MKRTRLVLLVLGGLSVAVVLAFLTIAFGLPALVKVVALQQLRSQLGRDASIDKISLDLWNGWYNVKNLRIAGRPGEPAFVQVDAIDLRLIYRYLFREGQI